MTKKIELSEEALKKLADSFERPERNYRTMWRMRVGGKFVRTGSGKHIWRRRGDALNALTFHLERVLTRADDGVYLGTDKLCDERYPDLTIISRQLVDNGNVELVEIPIDD